MRASNVQFATLTAQAMRRRFALSLLCLPFLLLPGSTTGLEPDLSSAVKDGVLRYSEALKGGEESRIDEFLPGELQWLPNYLRDLATKNPGPGPLRGVRGILISSWTNSCL